MLIWHFKIKCLSKLFFAANLCHRGFHPSGCLENFSYFLSSLEDCVSGTLQQNLPFHMLFFQCERRHSPLKHWFCYLFVNLVILCVMWLLKPGRKSNTTANALDMLVFETQPPWCKDPQTFQTYMRKIRIHIFWLTTKTRASTSTPQMKTP